MAKGNCFLLKINVQKGKPSLLNHARHFTGWEGSNKMVGCVQGMKAPGKQGMCF
jgi:hypothetical protein